MAGHLAFYSLLFDVCTVQANKIAHAKGKKQMKTVLDMLHERRAKLDAEKNSNGNTTMTSSITSSASSTTTTYVSTQTCCLWGCRNRRGMFVKVFVFCRFPLFSLI